VRILLLEDDLMLNELISERLSKKYTVASFTDGEKALNSVLKERYDLLLLDVDVPSINGFELLELLRTTNIITPAIFITAKTTSKDLKQGFEVGGNDYIKKPFDFEELEARIENIRKTYRIDLAIPLGENAQLKDRIIYANEKEIHIGAKESAVLGYLAKRKGTFVSCDELTSAVWSMEECPSQSTVRTYIKNLRHILGAASISTERGLGWRFDGV